jgi:hypothetical protein
VGSLFICGFWCIPLYGKGFIMKQITTKNCLDCNATLVNVGHAKKRCDICNKQYRKLYWSEREQNPKRKQDNIKRAKKFAQKNPDKIKEYNKKYRTGKSRDKYLLNKKINKTKQYNTNITTKLGDVLRSRLWVSLKKQGLKKNNSTMELTGCSKEELIQHLESQFSEGMTWENWSLNGWHIDHIRPISSFDLSDPAQVKECFHYSNLQPLWAIDNLKKSDSWESDPRDT